MAITSKRIEQLDVDINFKQGVNRDESEEVIESEFARNLRNTITNLLSDKSLSEAIESIDIKYHLEDN